MKIATFTSIAFLGALLAACGSDPASPDANGSSSDAPETSESALTGSAAEGDSMVLASRAEIEQAYNCRGVLSAAWAARSFFDDAPAEFAAIDSNMTLRWTMRAGRMTNPDLTKEDLDTIIARSVRVIATPQAMNEALPDIRACLAADKAK